MARNLIELRRKRYFKLSPHLAQIDNARLRSLLGENPSSAGWGRNHTLEIERSKVFVKRVPVTELEYENMLSTRNLYDLPTYYNYGVGSAGLGVFRELVTHIKTTNWVLEGAIATFPLTYHYRIVPFSGTRGEVDMERHERYVAYWGSNRNIGRYLLDRANANYELVLFLEHVPYTLEPWLAEHPSEHQRPLNDLRLTIDFLRQHGIIHFDAHFHNVLTDGEQAYLTDFGLVLDRSFELTNEEMRFFRRNTHYDYGQVLCSLDSLIFRAYGALPESEKRGVMDRLGVAEGARDDELRSRILENVEGLCDDGKLKLDKSYVASIVKYRDVLLLMGDFYSELVRNHQKNTKLRHAELRRRLEAAGFLSGVGSDQGHSVLRRGEHE